MLHHIMPVQVKQFDDYSDDAIGEMNDFIRNHDIVDVKMNTVVAITGNFFTRYLVIYRKYQGD